MDWTRSRERAFLGSSASISTVFSISCSKLATMVTLEQLIEKTVEIEAELPRKALSLDLVQSIEEFAPFGMGNPKPLFATKGLQLDDVRTVGSGKHLKVKASGIDGIGFGMGSWSDLLVPGSLANFAYYPEINHFNGRQSLQLKLKDIQI